MERWKRLIHHQSFDKLTGGRTGSLIDKTFDLVRMRSELDYGALRSCYPVGVIGRYCINVVWSTAASSVLVVGTVIATS